MTTRDKTSKCLFGYTSPTSKTSRSMRSTSRDTSSKAERAHFFCCLQIGSTLLSCSSQSLRCPSCCKVQCTQSGFLTNWQKSKTVKFAILLRTVIKAHKDRTADKAIDRVIVCRGIQKTCKSREFSGNLAHMLAVVTRLSFPAT